MSHEQYSKEGEQEKLLGTVPYADDQWSWQLGWRLSQFPPAGPYGDTGPWTLHLPAYPHFPTPKQRLPQLLGPADFQRVVNTAVGQAFHAAGIARTGPTTAPPSTTTAPPSATSAPPTATTVPPTATECHNRANERHNRATECHNRANERHNRTTKCHNRQRDQHRDPTSW